MVSDVLCSPLATTKMEVTSVFVTKASLVTVLPVWMSTSVRPVTTTVTQTQPATTPQAAMNAHVMQDSLVMVITALTFKNASLEWITVPKMQNAPTLKVDLLVSARKMLQNISKARFLTVTIPLAKQNSFFFGLVIRIYDTSYV